jgi:hypothetical protein
MLALRVQMNFGWNAGILQRNVVRQRVIHIVDIVILGLQQKRRRRLPPDVEIGIQRKLRIGIGCMTNHKLLGALFGIPLRRGQRQVPGIN